MIIIYYYYCYHYNDISVGKKMFRIMVHSTYMCDAMFTLFGFLWYPGRQARFHPPSSSRDARCAT